MIRCKDKSLYTGVALDVLKRFEEHKAGGIKSAKYLKSRGPLKLVWNKKIGGRSEALSLEYRLKSLPKEIKEGLVEGRIKISDVIEWHMV